jgi:hypothetical protein
LNVEMIYSKSGTDFKGAYFLSHGVFDGSLVISLRRHPSEHQGLKWTVVLVYLLETSDWESNGHESVLSSARRRSAEITVLS